MTGKIKEEEVIPGLSFKQQILSFCKTRLNRPHAVIIGAIIIITLLCLRACLNNLFTDWDDKGYILNNELIKSISWKGLKNIFSTPVMGNYHPLTILVYALEYNFVQFEPWLYHFDSLLAHLLATLLVYWLAFLLAKNRLAAFVTSLLFGIHPMHVEPVAWLAGRKDVLCAMFYFAACVAYLYFIRSHSNRKIIFYVCTIVLFIGAVLCKPTAVTLPLTLLLIDYYENVTFNKRLFFEKIPHFVLALIFGIISVKIQAWGLTVHKESYSFLAKTDISAYALITYLWKAVLPINLRCFYPYPAKINGTLPFIYNIFPLIIIGTIFLVKKYAANKKTIVFGLLFFTVNIVLLLQFIPVGDAILAERYAYIPYFGLFFIVGHCVSSSFTLGIKKAYRYALLMTYVICVVCLGYLSSERCKVWYDAHSLWKDEIKKEPVLAPIAYNNLGFYFFEKRQTDTDTIQQKNDIDSALHLLNKALRLKPDFVNACEGLGILYSMQGKVDSATYFFKTLIRINPVSNSWFDYGTVLYASGEKDSAIMAYSNAISLDTNNCNAYLNRDIIYTEQKRCDQAERDFRKIINLNPNIGIAYYQHSFCDTLRGNKVQALQDVENAISLGYSAVDTVYYKMLQSQ